MLTLAAARTLRRHLLELPDLVAEGYLTLGMQPGRGLASGRSTNPPESRPPVNLSLLALLGGGDWDGSPCAPGEEPSVDAVLSYWCQVFSEQPCRDVTTASQFLLLIHDEACQHERAEQYAEQIAWHHRRLTAFVGPVISRLRTLPGVCCPGCRQVALVDSGGAQLECSHCGTEVTREAYADAAARWYAKSA